MALGSMSAELIFRHFPFVLFLGFIALTYIANAHFAERKVRQIQVLHKEIRDLKREYNSLRSEITKESRLTELGKDLAPKGLKRTTRLPERVVVPAE